MGKTEDDDRDSEPKFRSVLPHEPLPVVTDVDGRGYVHLQGAFEPKPKTSSCDDDSEPNKTKSSHWKSPRELEEALVLILREKYEQLGLPFRALSIRVLDETNCSRLRVEYGCPYEALEIQYAFRNQRISPHDILGAPFGSRPCQATMTTTQPLPKDTSSYWPRSNPPQFRRLLHNRGNDEEERSKTRFVYVTGLVDNNQNEAGEWENPCTVYRVLRQVFGTDIEVFLPKKQGNQQQSKNKIQACHLGFRSAKEAREMVNQFQGRVVTWEFGAQTIQMNSRPLFLDYATITQKSMAKQRGDYENYKKGKGDPSRPECTSTTSHVCLPGLSVIENFLSQEEEKLLVAILTGPQAPWSPQQLNKSETGTVKRRVQHYGYVFDYQTADVLRRDEETMYVAADCPPLPSTTEEKKESMEDLVREGNGWEVLARVIEKVRQHEFKTDPGDEESVTQKLIYSELNQMTVNQYKPGEGIGSHVDTPSAFGDGLISVSLNSDVVMEFTKVVMAKNNDSVSETARPPKKLVYLPRRSLVLMSGPARYEWEHQIVTRRTDTHNGVTFPRGVRVSLTLRTALSLDGSPLSRYESNSFPPVWGHGGGKDAEESSSSGNALITPSTERDHVHAVYDAIATQWHHTRGKRGVLWPSATQFVQNLPEGSMVADVGCGDGKYFPAIWEAGSYVIGTDISLPLLETTFDESSGSTLPDTRKVSAYRKSLQKRPAVAVADCMSVPLRSNSCDAAICIAVMHHLSTTDRRLRCIEELSRVVKLHGKIHIQAWAMEQAADSRRRFAAPDVFVPFNAQPKYLDKVLDSNRKNDNTTTSSKPMDAANAGCTSKSAAELYSEAYEKADFDERKGLVVFQRYCHMYREGELDDLVRRVPSVRLLESGYESGNHYVILEVVSK